MLVAVGLLMILAFLATIINLVRLCVPSRRASGKRWALRSSIATIALLVLGSLLGAYEDNEDANRLGFASMGEMRDARKHGIQDPSEWNRRRPAIEAEEARIAEEEARRRAAADVAKARELEIAKAQKAQRDDDAAREKARFQCLSRWDGSFRDLVDEVTKNLRDPDSFEHVKTFASAVKPGGQQYITMEYRARNGFGGLNVAHAKATVQNDGCKLMTWSMR